MKLEELKTILKKEYPVLEVITIQSKDMVFEERVKQKCFHCQNYNRKWTCPGHLPAVDYRKLVDEYEHAAVIICKMPIDKDTVDEDTRYKSTNMVHRAMLYLESELYKPKSVIRIFRCNKAAKNPLIFPTAI